MSKYPSPRSKDRAPKKVTPAKIKHSALNLLSRREYGSAELAQKLNQKFRGAEVVFIKDPFTDGPDETGQLELVDMVDQIVFELVEDNMVSDQRFADSLVRSRWNRGYGPYYVRQELRQKGVGTELVEECMENFDENWTEVAQRKAQVRFAGLEDSRTLWTKAANYLQRKGFDRELINQALGDMPKS